MLNQSQNQNQPSFQQNQEEKSNNNDTNPILSSNNPKYSSSRPYQSQMDYRERSRSRDHSQRRQSFHEYRPGNNIKNQGQNNYNMNYRNNKPYYNRQNNEKQFENNNRYKNDRNQFKDNFNNGGYNSNYGPNKDDCLIVLPKNYYNFIAKDFDKIKSDLKRELKDDIYNITNNYSLPNIPESIFRFTTNNLNSYPLKTRAIKIIADFLFDIMKTQYENTTYLKLIFLIPDNVIGLIIGVNGKTINQIRDETNAKIEVFPPNNIKKFRKIEIAGVPKSIAEAGEKIYSIARKYFNFDDDKNINRNEHSPQRERDNWDRDRGFGMNNYKERDRFRRDKYHEDNRNKYFENERFNNNDMNYKGTFNKETNDFRDMGYREGHRNYNGRDNYMKNNYRDYREKNNNNNYNRDNNNYRDFRDNNQRYRNNYDKGNNKYYNDRNKQRSYNNEREQENLKNSDNWSKQSFSRDSKSEKSRENKSYNNNDGDWPEEKEIQNEENKEDVNENKENFELGEENDLKDNDNENNVALNEEQIQLKEDLQIRDNNGFLFKQKIIEVSNIENNNLNNIYNIDKERNDDEKEKGEIEESNNVVIGDKDESDKFCNLIVYLTSEEMNLLNNSKYDNIWNNLENSFQCKISINTKNIDNKEISLITFNGTPKQNTLAIYQLQKYLLDIKFERIESNKSDN